jgi:predicted RNase H-like nuclease (RuvC/YqgF family)
MLNERTVDVIERDIDAGEQEAERLKGEISECQTKLASFRQRYADAARARNGAETLKIRNEIDIEEFRLNDLQAALAEKESAIEALQAERQPIALQKAKEADTMRLSKLSADVDAARTAWLKSLEQTRTLEAEFYQSQKKHRTEADKVSESWAKLKIPAVA